MGALSCKHRRTVAATDAHADRGPDKQVSPIAIGNADEVSDAVSDMDAHKPAKPRANARALISADSAALSRVDVRAYRVSIMGALCCAVACADAYADSLSDTAPVETADHRSDDPVTIRRDRPVILRRRLLRQSDVR